MLHDTRCRFEGSHGCLAHYRFRALIDAMSLPGCLPHSIARAHLAAFARAYLAASARVATSRALVCIVANARTDLVAIGAGRHAAICAELPRCCSRVALEFCCRYAAWSQCTPSRGNRGRPRALAAGAELGLCCTTPVAVLKLSCCCLAAHASVDPVRIVVI